MIYWAIMLFGLGILALADFTVTGGEIFGSINSIIYLTLSFAILVRMRNKQKEGLIEKLQAENQELRHMVVQPEPGNSSDERVKEAMA